MANTLSRSMREVRQLSVHLVHRVYTESIKLHLVHRVYTESIKLHLVHRVYTESIKLHLVHRVYTESIKLHLVHRVYTESIKLHLVHRVYTESIKFFLINGSRAAVSLSKSEVIVQPLVREGEVVFLLHLVLGVLRIWLKPRPSQGKGMMYC